MIKMGWAKNVNKCPKGHTSISKVMDDVRVNYVSCSECEMVYYKEDYDKKPKIRMYKEYLKYQR